MAIIGSLMKTEMITARPEELVSDVAKRMRDNSVGAVLVIAGGRLEGLFSERDLLTRVVAEDRSPSATTVAEVATRNLVTVDVDTHVRQCAQLLREKRFRHLPVLEAGRPVGILSSRDFFEFVTEGLERIIDGKRYQREIEEGADPYDHIGGAYAR
jgi:CBS domain-containing protein